MRLKNKVAIITGATGDIGKNTAKKFLQEGAKVMLAGRSKEKLSKLQNELNVDGRVRNLAGDVCSESYVKTLIDQTLKEFNKVDIMFANAGTEGRTAALEEQKIEDFSYLLRINVIGVWLCIKHSIKAMKKKPRRFLHHSHIIGGRRFGIRRRGTLYRIQTCSERFSESWRRRTRKLRNSNQCCSSWPNRQPNDE